MNKLSANKIKELRKLQQKRYRTENGLFTVEGEKMVQEALKSGYEVLEIYRTDEIGQEAMSRITSLTSPSPVLAVVREPSKEKKEPLFSPSTDGLYLGLCGVRDPGNMGTIIRIADWFGVETIICSPDCVEIYNPKTIQATMGAIFRRRVVVTDMKSAIGEARNAGIPVYGTFLGGANLYNKSLSKRAMVLLGNESNGIPSDIEELLSQDEKLLIPPYPRESSTSESLNVATAAAIICAEMRRGN